MIVSDATMFIFIYASCMAVFYLLYSVMWKDWDGNSKKIYIFHGIAVLMAFLIVLLNNIYLSLLIQLLLFASLAIITLVSYIKSKNKKRKHNLYVIYLLLFLFLVMNVIGILIPNFFQTFHIIVYLASISIFLIILYKVLRKTGSD